MTSKLEKLPNSRVKILITAEAKDLTHAAQHAVSHATSSAIVKGFRPGKAPIAMLVAQVGKGRILSDLVDHAIPELAQQAAEEHKTQIIESPAYTIEKLPHLLEDGTIVTDSILEFTLEADVAPEVKVGDYTRLKVKSQKVDAVTDKDVDDFVLELAKRRAPWENVDRKIQKEDCATISFKGKRNGIPEDRLKSDDYPIVVGSNVMIPGFEDELIGLKNGEKKTFAITFPADYHAKDLANQEVVFEVEVKEAAERKLPVIDDTFAKEFDHKTLESLKKAIKEEREFYAAEGAKHDTEAKVLDEFEKLVNVEIPQSVLEKEIDRQIETMRSQVAMQGLKFDQYLEHLKKTEEQLRDDVKPTAEKAVRIGLGLGMVAEKEGIKDKEPGKKAIERLVELATKA